MSARYGFATLVLIPTALVVSNVRAEGAAGAAPRLGSALAMQAWPTNESDAELSSFRLADELEDCPELTRAELDGRGAEHPAAAEALRRCLGFASEAPRSASEQEQPTARVASSASSHGSRSSQSALVPAAARSFPDAALATAPPAPRRPPSFRLPAFIAFGVGGLGASGALATGLMASGRYNDPANCASQCDEGRAASSRTLAITSAVLTGVAAAGIGVGVVLLLANPAHSERNRLVPALRLKLSAEKAAAGAVWKF